MAGRRELVDQSCGTRSVSPPGGWTNMKLVLKWFSRWCFLPIWKIWSSKWVHLKPNFGGDKKKSLKPPPSFKYEGLVNDFSCFRILLFRVSIMFVRFSGIVSGSMLFIIIPEQPNDLAYTFQQIQRSWLEILFWGCSKKLIYIYCGSSSHVTGRQYRLSNACTRGCDSFQATPWHVEKYKWPLSRLHILHTIKSPGMRNSTNATLGRKHEITSGFVFSHFKKKLDHLLPCCLTSDLVSQNLPRLKIISG